MRRLRAPTLFVAVVGLVFVGLAISFDRQALAVGSQIRTFVARTGSDANPCSRTAPCRTFAAALVQTASGGEVVALDTGGYGTLTINQSVTITAAPGVQAFIAPSSGTAIEVNAGGGVVTLRNLILNSQGADVGIDYVSGGVLHIENLTISGFYDRITSLGWGIRKWYGGAYELHVTDTVVRGSYWGIGLDSFETYAHATILRTRVLDGVFGIDVGSYVHATIKDSVIAHHAVGVTVSDDLSASDANLEDCLLTGNGTALSTDGISSLHRLRVSNSVITGNGNGIAVFGGQILSRGNNTLEGNTTNGTFTGTYSPK